MGLVANKRYGWKQMFKLVMPRNGPAPTLTFIYDVDDLKDGFSQKTRMDLEDYGFGVDWGAR